MKQIAMGVVSFIIVVLFISICLNINGRYIREQDVINNLTEAIESSARSVWINEMSSITTNEELAEYFVESLVYQIESKDSITINVVEADVEKGLLAVDMVQTFAYSDGTEGNVYYQKVIILDQIVIEELPQYEITFYLSEEDKDTGMIYKSYVLEEGIELKTPTIPVDATEGKDTFIGWLSTEGEVNTTLVGIVDHSTYYIAQFN